MAGGMDLGNSGKGGKKPLDTAINLVPFIDLMAVTISFLIMTAVWTQIGKLQVSQGGESSEPSDQQQDTLPVTLTVTDKDMKLTVGNDVFDTITVVHDSKDRLDVSKLAEKLKEMKEKVLKPEQNAITLQAADTVPYDDLVRIIDQCIGAKMENVSVATAG